MKIPVLLLCSVVALTCAVEVKRSRRFPKHFIFGTSTAAHQIEGAWDADDKSESIWDFLAHNNPGAISDQSNGDIACDSYHKYLQARRGDDEGAGHRLVPLLGGMVAHPAQRPGGPRQRYYFQWAMYTDPIFSKDGGFPKELLELVAQKSAAQGYPRTKLPDFTEEEKAYIRGTSDFFGVNHYTGVIVTGWKPTATSSTAYVEIGRTQDKDWPQAVSYWLRQMPKSLYIALNAIQKRYGDVPIYVTENGWSIREGIEDDERVHYYRDALEDVLDALDEGIDVRGYYAWSLMDNFEWLAGYTERFGFYEINFADPELTRIPRKSAFIYKQIIKTREIDYDYQPESYVMTIDPRH